MPSIYRQIKDLFDNKSRTIGQLASANLDIFPGPSHSYYKGRRKADSGIFFPNTKKIKENISNIISEFEKEKKPTEDHEIRTIGSLSLGKELGILNDNQNALYKSLSKKYLKTFQMENKYNPMDAGVAGLGVIAGSLAAMPAMEAASRLTKNPSVGKLIMSMAKQKGVDLKHVEIIPRSTGSYFDPLKKIIVTGPSEAVALHELGHAKDFKKFPAIKTALRFSAANIPILERALGRMMPTAIARTPILSSALLSPLVVSSFRKRMASKDEGSVRSKAVGFIEKHPWTIGTAAYSPVLYSEAKASALALKDLAKLRGASGVLKGMAALAPAFGTYAAAGGLAGLASHKLVRRQQELAKARRDRK